MKILIVSRYGQQEIKQTDFIPRVGDKVDMFYHPFPTVSQVLLWPSETMTKDLNVKDLDAIVTVE